MCDPQPAGLDSPSRRPGASRRHLIVDRLRRPRDPPAAPSYRPSDRAAADYRAMQAELAQALNDGPPRTRPRARAAARPGPPAPQRPLGFAPSARRASTARPQAARRTHRHRSSRRSPCRSPKSPPPASAAASRPNNGPQYVLEHLSAQSVVLASGATRITTASKVIHVPRLTSDGSAGWFSELEELDRRRPHRRRARPHDEEVRRPDRAQLGGRQRLQPQRDRRGRHRHDSRRRVEGRQGDPRRRRRQGTPGRLRPGGATRHRRGHDRQPDRRCWADRRRRRAGPRRLRQPGRLTPPCRKRRTCRNARC